MQTPVYLSLRTTAVLSLLLISALECTYQLYLFYLTLFRVIRNLTIKLCFLTSQGMLKMLHPSRRPVFVSLYEWTQVVVFVGFVFEQ